MTAPASTSARSAGQVVAARFELLERLYHDGFGDVFSARDRKTGQAVSMRALASDAVANGVRGALRELVGFTHPNVLPSLGVIGEPGLAWLVQGAVEGQSLAAFVAARVGKQPVSLRGAYNVIAHVCNALTALHQTGPHGAIRPGCVWIGSDGKVQVGDLAVARATLQLGGAGGLPDDEVAYLAPEIKSGGAPTPQSDIFGVGALLYVLLTGRSPRDAFIAPSQAHAEASPALDAELMRALGPDPRVRHASPDAFRTALLALLADAEQESTEDFGVDVEVEVNLASLPPSRRPGKRSTGEIPIEIPKAPRMPGMQLGAVEMKQKPAHEAFRPSIVEIDDSELLASRKAEPLAEADLKGVYTKITEDDAPRWMLMKAGMDHGPFSGRQIVNMIVKGEALREHELTNTDTRRHGKIGEFAEFGEFLAQYELRRGEQERAEALTHADRRESRSAMFKLAVGVGAVALIGLGGAIYALSRGSADKHEGADAQLDMYKRGELEISGSAGILPPPRAGTRRSSGVPSGGSGAGLSYEDAMMQAVDLGSATGGGEQQLSAGTVAGVINRNLNQIYNACVKGTPGEVRVDVAIGGSGQVMGVTVTAKEPALSRCVGDQVRRIRFPSFSAPRMGARYVFGK
ncbi:MAG: protein kinase [Polyangiales bacterium]